MAKAKNITAGIVNECCEKAGDAAELAVLIRDAVNACRSEEIPLAFVQAKTLMAAARDLTEAAMALLNQHQLQEMQAKLKD